MEGERGGECPTQFEEGHILEKVRGDQGVVLLHLGSILAHRRLCAVVATSASAGHRR